MLTQIFCMVTLHTMILGESETEKNAYTLALFYSFYEKRKEKKIIIKLDYIFLIPRRKKNGGGMFYSKYNQVGGNI